MSPTDTAGNGKARTGVGTTRRRVLAALAGAGVLAAVPLTVEAVDSASTAVQKGQPVVASAKTPPPVKRALAKGGPVVVAFLLPGMTEDEIVQKRLNNLQRQGKFKDTTFIVYRITNSTRLGDLPTMFDVKYTPAVAVVQGDDKLSNVWRGLVDEDIIAQSLIDARAAVPQPVSVPPRKGVASGDPAGIALAKRVNAHYAKVPGVTMTGTVGKATGTASTRLVKGLSVATVARVGAVDMILNRTGAYTRAAGAGCWTRHASAKAVNGLYDPAIPTKGVRFAKPERSGKTFVLRASDVLGQYGGAKGSVTTYTIDAATAAILSEEAATGKASVTSLAKAPVIPKPDTLC